MAASACYRPWQAFLSLKIRPNEHWLKNFKRPATVTRAAGRAWGAHQGSRLHEDPRSDLLFCSLNFKRPMGVALSGHGAGSSDAKLCMQACTHQSLLLAGELGSCKLFAASVNGIDPACASC